MSKQNNEARWAGFVLLPGGSKTTGSWGASSGRSQFVWFFLVFGEREKGKGVFEYIKK